MSYAFFFIHINFSHRLYFVNAFFTVVCALHPWIELCVVSNVVAVPVLSSPWLSRGGSENELCAFFSTEETVKNAMIYVFGDK